MGLITVTRGWIGTSKIDFALRFNNPEHADDCLCEALGRAVMNKKQGVEVTLAVDTPTETTYLLGRCGMPPTLYISLKIGEESQ